MTPEKGPVKKVIAGVVPRIPVIRGKYGVGAGKASTYSV
jgi:hypothetical protein